MARMSDPCSTSVDAETISRRQIIRKGKKHKRELPDAPRTSQRQEAEVGGRQKVA